MKKKINEDLKSRFCTWSMGYPSQSDEKKIVDTTGVPADFVKGLFKLAQEMRALEAKGELEYALSPRDLVDIMEIYRSYAEDSRLNAKKLCIELKVLGNFDTPEQIDTIKSRIESIFGRNIFQEFPDKLTDEEIEEGEAEGKDEDDNDDDDEGVV